MLLTGHYSNPESAGLLGNLVEKLGVSLMRLPVQGMDAAGVVKLTPIVLPLEIDRESAPIAGRLRAEPDLVVAFTGWLGLVSALEKTGAFDGSVILEQDPDDDP